MYAYVKWQLGNACAPSPCPPAIPALIAAMPPQAEDGLRATKIAEVHAVLTIWNLFDMSKVQPRSGLRDNIMRRAVALVGLFGIIGAGMSLALLPATGTVAAPKAERTYLIPAGDGYGVADCISSKSECGQIVADAWCESQGHRAATAYGLAKPEDFTGSTPRQASAPVAEQPLAITCGG
ncbi:hypothetical protein [Bosea lupini]|nr:hypothetical protein [Bosea lupini]